MNNDNLRLLIDSEGSVCSYSEDQGGGYFVISFIGNYFLALHSGAIELIQFFSPVDIREYGRSNWYSDTIWKKEVLLLHYASEDMHFVTSIPALIEESMCNDKRTAVMFAPTHIQPDIETFVKGKYVPEDYTIKSADGL